MRSAFRWLAYWCLAVGAIGVLLGVIGAFSLMSARSADRSADLAMAVAGFANGLVLLLIGLGVRSRSRPE